MARKALGYGTLSLLALRNVARSKARTALVLASIGTGVAGLVLSGGFVHDLLFKLGEALIRSQSGHVQIGKAGYFDVGARSPAKYLISAQDAQRMAPQELPHVTAAMRRLAFSGLLSNGRSSYPIVGEGIEPGEESKLATYMRFATGRNLAPGDRNRIIVGAGVARALGLRAGSVVNLVAPTVDEAMNTLEFEVAGIFQSFSSDYDDRTIKIPLADAQELIDTQGVNVLVLLLDRTVHTGTTATQARTRAKDLGLEMRTWEQLNDFYSKAVDLYDRQFGVLRLIVLVVVLVAVAGAINVSVVERAGEFGTMKVLGNERRDVVALILAEALVLGCAGALLGVLLGCAGAYAVSRIGIPMPPPPNSNLGYVAQIPIVPAVVAGALSIGVAATVLAALAPAVRMSRLPIAEALRRTL